MFSIFCSFTLTSLREKNILPNLTNSQEPEPGVFSSLEPEQEPEPPEKETRSRSRSRLGKKIRSRSRLKKKSGAGAGATKKFAGSPALILEIIIFMCI